MRNEDFTPETIGENLQGIVGIESSSDTEEFDYDFDYDPNQMYYELNGISE